MNRAIMGTRFELDKEKIEREGIYSLEKMQIAIDKAAKDSNLIKVNDNYYITEGKETDIGCLGAFIFCYMLQYDWFTKNLKNWWHMSNINDKNEDEDLITFLKSKNDGIWN